MSMSSIPPNSGSTGPINFKAAQAYAANRPAPVSGASAANAPAAAPRVTDQVSFSAVAGKIQPKAKVGTATPVAQPTAASKAKISSIVAAQVPGKVSFDSASTTTTSTPQPTAPKPAFPFYTNPTMKNTAATGIAASRSLDTQA